MSHPERVEHYLEHIAEAIDRATGYLRAVFELEAFKQNPQVEDAVNSIAPDFINQHPELPWAQMRAAQCSDPRILLCRFGNCLENRPGGFAQIERED